jgi:protein-arginine kinase activator protein McsA
LLRRCTCNAQDCCAIRFRKKSSGLSAALKRKLIATNRALNYLVKRTQFRNAAALVDRTSGGAKSVVWW